MRRILLLLAVATMMLTLAASLALALSDGPTNNNHNCYGDVVFDGFAGESEGDFPGSKHDPADATNSWNGPVTKSFANQQLIDDFNTDFADREANCGDNR